MTAHYSILNGFADGRYQVYDRNDRLVAVFYGPDAERRAWELKVQNDGRCHGATPGKAPSPGCGHGEHAPYRCEHRDDDGVPCDCAGSATDDDPKGES